MRILVIALTVFAALTLLNSCDDDADQNAPVATGWKHSAQYINDYIYDAEFVNDSTAFLLMEGDSMAVTRNGGKTWTYFLHNMHPGSRRSWAIDLHAFNEDEMVVVGADGLSQRTSDGGQSWSVFNFTREFDLKSLDFQDANFGWCCAYSSSEYFLTYDGGSTWEEYAIVDEDGELYRGWNDFVHFWPDGSGIMVADWSGRSSNSGSVTAIFRTKDLGQNWEREFLDEEVEELANINVIGPHVWMHELIFNSGHSSDKIWYSSDYGATFEIIHSDAQRNLVDLHFVNESRGWKISRAGKSVDVNNHSQIEVTNDGGRTWTTQPIERIQWHPIHSLARFAHSDSQHAIVYSGGPGTQVFWTRLGGDAFE